MANISFPAGINNEMNEVVAMTDLSAKMHQAFHSVRPDGRLPREAHDMLVRAFTKISQDIGKEKVIGPEEFLGSFEVLPDNAKEALVRALISHDKWSMAGHEIGEWHFHLARVFTKARRVFVKRKLHMLAKVAELLAILSQSAPAHLINILHKKSKDWKERYSFTPTFANALRTTKIDLINFAVCYARGIPQPRAYRGFCHDSSRHNTWGVIIGIDFLPTSEGYWFIESNLNSGMSSARCDIYDRDPFVENLLLYTQEKGYRQLMILHNSCSHMNKVMAKSYEVESRLHDVKLSIVEDAYLPASSFRQSFGVPDITDSDTLVVRTKLYRTSLDHILQNKQASMRALEIYRGIEETTELLLPLSDSEPVPIISDPAEPFPNLVYKMPERDAGEGVIFLKVSSKEAAHSMVKKAIRDRLNRKVSDRLFSLIEDRNGLYQRYIRSSMLDGRKLYKVRAHVLLTPVGLRFLSAHRVISRFSVPEQLPDGVVTDHRPYLVNLSTSSHYQKVPLEEEPAVVKSALAVAKGLSWAVEYGFQTGSADEAGEM